jgi:peptide/nickel transport system permease protein
MATPHALAAAPTAARQLITFLRRHWGLVLGLSVLSGMLLAAFFLPLPYDPLKPDPAATLKAPSGDHRLGTDLFGFDVFSRIIIAARLDLPLAIAGALVSMLIGVPLGLLASIKGRLGEGLMRGLDAFQAFPLLILAVAIVTLSGNRLENVVLAIAIINIPRFMRLVRSEVLSLREARFVEAAIAFGAGRFRVMFRHLLPNVSGIILALVSLATAHAILVIAALSFIGVGISPPDASWGAMIQSGAGNIVSGQWWVALFPGMAVVVAVISLNLVADGLERVFDKSLANV